MMLPSQLQTVLDHDGKSVPQGCFTISTRMQVYREKQTEKVDHLRSLGLEKDADALAATILSDNLQNHFMQAATQVLRAQEDDEKEELRSRNETLVAQLEAAQA